MGSVYVRGRMGRGWGHLEMTPAALSMIAMLKGKGGRGRGGEGFIIGERLRACVRETTEEGVLGVLERGDHKSISASCLLPVRIPPHLHPSTMAV